MRRCFSAARCIARGGRQTSTVSFAWTSVDQPSLAAIWQGTSQSTRSGDSRRPQLLCELFDESPAGRCAKRLELHEELCVRLNWAIQQLHDLPAGLSQAVGVADAISSYRHSLETLARCTSDSDWVADQASVLRALKHSYETRTNVIYLITLEVRSVQARLGACDYDRYYRQAVDAHLEHFFAGHVGIRFLKHQLMRMAARAASPIAPRAVCGRIVTSSRSYSTLATQTSCCNPAEIAQMVARQCEDLCLELLRRKIEIVVQDKSQVELQFWPAALNYALCEVMKNACKAVAERYSDDSGKKPPPVICSIEADDRWVRIFVKDAGHGIPTDRLKHIWGFAWSGGTEDSVTATRLSGHGVGLPLSRLYLRYFGGDVQVMCNDKGRGTTVQLMLDRRSSRCAEALMSP